MRTSALAFAAALLYVFAGYSYAALSCSIGSSAPSASETTVLKLFSADNTHASLPADANAALYLNCMDTGGSAITTSSAGTPFLRLTSAANAHVQQTGSSPQYPVTAYIGTNNESVACAYAASCSGYGTCLASITGVTNSHIGSCGSFPLKICCRLGNTTLPDVSISYSPQDIGSLTVVTYTATATSASGINNVRIFVDGAMKNQCSSSPCTYSEGGYAAGSSHSAYATADDMFSNTGISSTAGFTVCKLDSASVSFAGNALPGSAISINAAYHGACPANPHIQIDGSGRGCSIAASGADMTGMNGACSSPACAATWTVPVVPLKCQGSVVTATSAALYKTGPAPAGERLDGTPASGSFRFYFDAANALTSGFTLSKNVPNLGETTTGMLSCFVSSEAGATADCDNSNFNVSSIKIDEADYIAAERWEQGAFFNAADKRWEIPVDTSKYHSLINVSFVYIPGNIPGNELKSYIVNFPPVISNAMASPRAVFVGRNVTFSANVRDPDAAISGGIDVVKACASITSGACGSQYCDMALKSGNRYECSYNTSSLPPGAKNFVVFASDMLGAWNSSGQSWNAINESAPQNQTFEVNITNIDVDLEFPDVTSRLVPTTSPEPNFTRSMSINFLLKASLRDALSRKVKSCVQSTCTAHYNVDGPTDAAGPGWVPLQWDAFSAAWAAAPSSVDLVCDRYHDLNVKAESTEIPGLVDVKTYKFYVSCVPRVTVTPIEKRFVLGDNGATVFNVSLWNPQDRNSFTLQMRPQRPDGLPLQWVSLVCGQDCGQLLDATGQVINDDEASITVDKVGSNSVLISMPVAAKSGTYPIRFVACTPDCTSASHSEYGATGTIQIYAEGLGEFPPWQIIAVIAAALALFAFAGSRKAVSAGKKRRSKKAGRKKPAR